MVFEISTFFRGTSTLQRRPMLNQLPISTTNQIIYATSTVLQQKKKFVKWFRTRPELNSPVQIRVDDTISDVEFFDTKGMPLGRNKKLEAQAFWRMNQVFERFKTLQYDRLVTGSGFLWLGFNDIETVGKVTKQICDKYWFKSMNMKQIAKDILTKRMDEDLRKPRIIDNVPSSTVIIKHTLQEITSYVQHFIAHSIEFRPDEIVHIPLISFDGKVDGFTPVFSLAYELTLLWAIKENMLAYFRNGGSPSKIFSLPEESQNSENFMWLKQQLSDINAVQARNGNLVLAGEVKVEDFASSIKDMEYETLALYVTSNIAYALRVPISRIPYMIGKAQSSGDAGGLSESGYWSMIESDQRLIEDATNQQIFRPLGFMFKFKKRYKLDDARENQSLDQRMDAISKIDVELAKTGMKLKSAKLLSLISGHEMEISEQDIEPMTEDDKLNSGLTSGLLGQTGAPGSQTGPSEKKQSQNDTKRQGGLNNPSGSNQTGR